ncbi:MAG: S41 family peptidase, partial [Pseudobutyrivibrio sp.]|nr:S41 family peptidase [Pseudobutyrivibrio sp.]
EDFTSSGRTKKTIPMVVLVNENTASAAEIFTGAIRDFKYGTIIGTTTFGKGIVQSTIPLEDGSAVKLTTQTYYTPSGECIHGTGITPDIELEYKFGGEEGTEYTVDLDNQIQKALEVLSE